MSTGERLLRLLLAACVVAQLAVLAYAVWALARPA